MFLYKAFVEYNGLFLFGWQKQIILPTVQSEIEKAISKIISQKIFIFSGSRTDSKVHAFFQIIYFRLNTKFSEKKLQHGLNYLLFRKKIVIKKVRLIYYGFHSRYDIKSKIYFYRILNRSSPSMLDIALSWHIFIPLNIYIMSKAASYLVGKHDFSSFRAKGCQAISPIITLNRVNIIKPSNNIILIIFEAQSFIYHQIRIIVGTLVQFGLEKYSHILMKKILNLKSRKFTNIIAPAYALYLKEIKYI